MQDNRCSLSPCPYTYLAIDCSWVSSGLGKGCGLSSSNDWDKLRLLLSYVVNLRVHVVPTTRRYVAGMISSFPYHVIPRAFLTTVATVIAWFPFDIRPRNVVVDIASGHSTRRSFHGRIPHRADSVGIVRPASVVATIATAVIPKADDAAKKVAYLLLRAWASSDEYQQIPKALEGFA
jgi:hypothetical protein